MSKIEITKEIEMLIADKKNAEKRIRELNKAREIVADNLNPHANDACVHIDFIIEEWKRVIEIATAEIAKDKKKLKLMEHLEALDNE